jgi:hypothetical protein
MNRARIILAGQVSDEAEEINVKAAAALVMIRTKGPRNAEVVRKLFFHANEKVRRIGCLVRAIKNDRRLAGQIVESAFRHPFLAVDYIPFLLLIAASKVKDVFVLLHKTIISNSQLLSHPNMDARELIAEIKFLCVRALIQEMPREVSMGIGRASGSAGIYMLRCAAFDWTSEGPAPSRTAPIPSGRRCRPSVTPFHRSRQSGFAQPWNSISSRCM